MEEDRAGIVRFGLSVLYFPKEYTVCAGQPYMYKDSHTSSEIDFHTKVNELPETFQGIPLVFLGISIIRGICSPLMCIALMSINIHH